MNTKWNRVRISIIFMLTLLTIFVTSGEIMAAPGCTQSYTVQRGDTLARIAQNYGVTTQGLQSINNIRNANHIFIGQQLCIQLGADGDEGHTTESTTIQALANLNVRSGPSLQHLVVGWLQKGATATALERSSDGQWWRIVCPTGGGSGCWVTAQRDLIRPISQQDPAPQAPGMQATNVTAVTVIPDQALLYAGPGTMYPVVGSMFGGLPIPIDGVSADGNWWHASCPNTAGQAQCEYWISAATHISQPIQFP